MYDEVQSYASYLKLISETVFSGENDPYPPEAYLQLEEEIPKLKHGHHICSAPTDQLAVIVEPMCIQFAIKHQTWSRIFKASQHSTLDSFFTFTIERLMPKENMCRFDKVTVNAATLGGETTERLLISLYLRTSWSDISKMEASRLIKTLEFLFHFWTLIINKIEEDGVMDQCFEEARQHYKETADNDPMIFEYPSHTPS